ncbi:MAG: DUF4317 domain-containing protein [Christensenellaceae bacterium]|nr:DUF4317 domain-containing protein [Christensenellaceae bacterium]
MNDKEIREIRKRFRPEKNAMGKIYGCYVNEAGTIMASFEESMAFMPDDEAERFLTLMKRSISGSLGKNLLNLEFTSKQVMESDEHKLLTALRNCELKDEGLRKAFFERIAGHVRIDGGYVIMLVFDTYDVPFRNKEDKFDPEKADEEFSYFVCAVCPVKQTSAGLGYHAGENSVHSTFQGLLLAPPEIGFMFPLFDDRAANIYGVLYHIKQASNTHEEFSNIVFGIEPPMSATDQKENFHEILSSTLKEDCSLDMIHAVYEQLTALIEEHKESKEPEQLLISKYDITSVLENCEIAEEKIKAFSKAFDERFGEDAELSAENIIEKRQFVISTPETVIKVDPDKSGIIDARIINGVKYILVPAGNGMDVNGLNVQITEK